ncbi:hypothetical protein [Olivibacter sitiensis]|uniref:hypothetical protein n=1 Tax=Olivibacter sitiensis TaxID=376470 RepID=UPI0003FA8A41|nr:hypothetical protein [Olivibacter sitiensis]
MAQVRVLFLSLLCGMEVRTIYRPFVPTAGGLKGLRWFAPLLDRARILGRRKFAPFSPKRCAGAIPVCR